MIRTSPDNSTTCTISSGGLLCGAEKMAHSQLWWTARQAAGGQGRIPPFTESLRRWSGVMIDAILAFHEDMTRLPGPQARFWQARLALFTDQSLRPITGGLPARRWLVHARHRTQAHASPARDRQLYQSWVPHLVAAVLELMRQTATAAAHITRTRQAFATAAYLQQARHNLQHACRHLNQPGMPGNIPHRAQ